MRSPQLLRDWGFSKCEGATCPGQQAGESEPSQRAPLRDLNWCLPLLGHLGRYIPVILEGPNKPNQGSSLA